MVEKWQKKGPVGLPAGPGDPLPLARGRDLEEIRSVMGSDVSDRFGSGFGGDS